MKLISCLLIIFLLSLSKIQAQQLSPGDDCTAITAAEVWNYDLEQLSLATYKGKWIILDFWNHSCITCIQSFSKMEKLQQQFNKHLQIILVSKESADSTIRFFKKHKRIPVPSFPFITAAISIWHRFNPDHTPFQAWIDDKGILRYITGPYNLTTAHIQEVLEGKKLDIASALPLPKKQTGPSFSWDNIHTGFQSRILPCAEGSINKTFEAQHVANGRFIRMSRACSSVGDLLMKAFSEYDKYNFKTPAQLIWLLEDKTPYTLPIDPDRWDNWKKQYSYSYELILPVQYIDQRYQFMQQDIQRFFGLKVSREKKELPALSLVSTGDNIGLQTRAMAVTDNLRQSSLRNPVSDSIRSMNNKPFKELADRISSWVLYYLKIPFQDKTGYTGNIDISLSEKAIDPFNWEQLNKELSKYNLKLVKDSALTDVLIIRKY